MGHVTDGGLEPEPVVSIKGPGRPVNRVLARFGTNFRYFPANFRMEDAGRGGMVGIGGMAGRGEGSPLRGRRRFLIKAVWPAACIRRR